MSYSQEIKNEVLKKLMEEGIKASTLSLQYGMSVATIYKWKHERLEEIADREDGTENTFQANRKNFVDRIKVDEETINENNKKKEAKREKKFYNSIIKYLEEKRHEIYVNMQSENYETQKIAISQWDRMEVLMEKVEQNKENSEYLNTLNEKINKLKNIENSRSR